MHVHLQSLQQSLQSTPDRGAKVSCDVGKLCFQPDGHADADVPFHGDI